MEESDTPRGLMCAPCVLPLYYLWIYLFLANIMQRALAHVLQLTASARHNRWVPLIINHFSISTSILQVDFKQFDIYACKCDAFLPCSGFNYLVIWYKVWHIIVCTIYFEFLVPLHRCLRVYKFRARVTYDRKYFLYFKKLKCYCKHKFSDVARSSFNP